MADSTNAIPASEEAEPEGRALPAIGTLTQRQQRGMDCVHCGIVLTPETAVPIPGEHWFRRCGTRTRWYPRSCRRHAAAH